MQRGVARRSVSLALLLATVALVVLAAGELLVESSSMYCWSYEECLTKATALLAKALRAAALVLAALGLVALLLLALRESGEQSGCKVHMW